MSVVFSHMSLCDPGSKQGGTAGNWKRSGGTSGWAEDQGGGVWRQVKGGFWLSSFLYFLSGCMTLPEVKI